MITATVFILITIMYTTGCKPNGNNNSTDVHNSMGEGVDTTHLIDKDSLPASPYQPDTPANADTRATKPAGQ